MAGCFQGRDIGMPIPWLSANPKTSADVQSEVQGITVLCVWDSAVVDPEGLCCRALGKGVSGLSSAFLFPLSCQLIKRGSCIQKHSVLIQLTHTGASPEKKAA